MQITRWRVEFASRETTKSQRKQIWFLHTQITLVVVLRGITPLKPLSGTTKDIIRGSPVNTTLARLHQQLWNSDYFHTVTHIRDRTTRMPTNDEIVIGGVGYIYNRNTRGMTNKIAISRRRIWIILKSNDMHPYDLQRVHCLKNMTFNSAGLFHSCRIELLGAIS